MYVDEDEQKIDGKSLFLILLWSLNFSKNRASYEKIKE